MKKKVFVSGASGFLGSHCITDLLRHNYSVVGTMRDVSKEKTLRKIIYELKLDNTHMEIREAELKNQESILSAMQGCDCVFHVASPVPIVQPKARSDILEIIKIAESGTLNVLKAANQLQKKISKIIW